MRRTVTTRVDALEYELNRTKRRSLEIRVPAPDSVRLFAPLRSTLRACDAFIRERADWILDAQASIRQRQAERPQTKPLEDGSAILYRGQAVPLSVRFAPRARVLLSEQGVSVLTPTPDDPYVVREQLRKCLIERARDVMEQRVAFYVPRIGRAPNRIAIREQKTRWGSCSSRENLNFNWKLILAPPQVLDYVVVHELCHLHELNHSPAFWNRVASHMPDYPAWRAWLKQNGKGLEI